MFFSSQWKEKNGWKVMAYVGPDAPIQTDTPGVAANRYRLPKGRHSIPASPDSIQSIYLMSGKIEIEGYEMLQDSFTKVTNLDKISLMVQEDSELFILESPLSVNYQRIADS